MKKTGFLVCAALFILASCEKEAEIVDLTVGWTIGLEQPDGDICSRAGIQDIHVSLDGLSDSYERTGGCSDGEIRFVDIPQIGYEVAVSGLNEDGCPVYFGETFVNPGDLESELQTLRLEAIPATGSLTVGWWFSDGKFCSHHGVGKVRLVVFKDDVQIINYEIDCEDGQFVLDDAETGRYSVRIEAEAEEGLLCSEYHDLVLEPCGVIEVEEALATCL